LLKAAPSLPMIAAIRTSAFPLHNRLLNYGLSSGPIGFFRRKSDAPFAFALEDLGTRGFISRVADFEHLHEMETRPPFVIRQRISVFRLNIV
jgi:hypothetical protein